MAHDDKAADRVRSALANHSGVLEIRMMGGLVFMVQGHMCCGIHDHDLMVRVGPKAYEKALREPHAKPLDIGGGRRPRAFICVEPEGYSTEQTLTDWVARGLEFVATLPEKEGR